MSNDNIALKTFKPWRIVLAVCLGFGFSAYLFYTELEGRSITELFKLLQHPNWLWLILGVVVLGVRDFGYIFRIRNLTKKHLSWKSSFFVIMLWEFASAITPSVVGGTAVAIFLLNKEKIKMGKSIAYVTLTAILDNLFFITIAPLGLFFLGDVEPIILGGYSLSLVTVFFISYLLIASYTLFMAFGVLINPKLFQKIVLGVVKLLRLKSKYKYKGIRLTLDNIEASKELKGLGYLYWLKAIGSTLFVWCARYFMLNCLLAAYTPMTFTMHEEALGKQVVLWVTQLISPTPGGSGFTEFFLKKLFPGGLIITAITLLWRVFTYYTYLAIGSVCLPKWLRKIRKG